MLLLLKCFDIKKVKSLNDLVIIDWVLGGEPTKKKYDDFHSMLLQDLAYPFNLFSLTKASLKRNKPLLTYYFYRQMPLLQEHYPVQASKDYCLPQTAHEKDHQKID